MVTLSSLLPKRSERAFINGQTGSGKTVLARFMLDSRKEVVVIDPKRRIQWSGYKVCQSLRSLVTESRNNTRLIYKPSHVALKGWKLGTDSEIEKVFEWVYLRGKTTLYVDEVYLVTSGEQLPQFYHACLTQGRELGIETWSATQRPMHVPQVTMSEAEQFYCFYQRMPQDRKKIEEMAGIDADSIGELPKHYFYYATQDGRETLGPFKLEIDRKLNTQNNG
jgi:Cdc6-like AAA superfamily ATPase